MFGFGKIRLRGVDRKVIRDDAHAEDYKLARRSGAFVSASSAFTIAISV